MIALDSGLAQNGAVNKRYAVQSIAASEEEKLLIHTLAVAYGVKPATAARFLLYRGVEAFLEDGSIKSPRTDTVILDDWRRAIAEDGRLSDMKDVAVEEIKASAQQRKTQKDDELHPTDAEIEAELTRLAAKIDAEDVRAVGKGGAGRIPASTKEKSKRLAIEERRQEMLAEREANRRKQRS